MDLRFSIADLRWTRVYGAITSHGRQPADDARPSRQARRVRGLPPAARGAAFTLIELLLSMFILAIGMVAVASIFPVAGYLQKNAFADVLTLQVKRQAVAIVGAVDVPDSALPSSPGDVEPLNNLDTHFPLEVRAYPQVSNRPIGQRQFYWVPLVQNVGSTASPEYRYYAFILERANDGEYDTFTPQTGWANFDDPLTVPKVRELGVTGGNAGADEFTADHKGNIQPGDQLLASTGQILQVTDVDGDTISIAGELADNINAVWYGRAVNPGDVTSTRRIIAIGGGGGQ